MNFPSRGAPSVNESLLAGGKAGNVGKGKVGLLGSTANLANAAIGAGVLAFPLAYAEAGLVLGPCLTLFFAATLGYTLHVIATAADAARSTPGGSAGSYQEIVKTLLGPAAEKAVIWLQVVYLTGCNVCMLIIICDQLKPVLVHHFGESSVEVRYLLVAVAWAVCFPLSLIRDMSVFAWPSLASQLGIFFAVAVVIAHSAAAGFGAKNTIKAGTEAGLLLCVPETYETWIAQEAGSVAGIGTLVKLRLEDTALCLAGPPIRNSSARDLITRYSSSRYSSSNGSLYLAACEPPTPALLRLLLPPNHTTARREFDAAEVWSPFEAGRSPADPGLCIWDGPVEPAKVHQGPAATFWPLGIAGCGAREQAGFMVAPPKFLLPVIGGLGRAVKADGGRCLVAAGTDIEQQERGTIRLWGRSPTAAVTSLPLICFGFQCHLTFSLVYDSLANPTPGRIDVVSYGCMALCAALYITMGIFGYLLLGDAATADVLEDLVGQGGGLQLDVSIARYCVAVKVACSYAMLCHVTKTALKDLVLPRGAQLSLPAHIGLTAGFVAVTMTAGLLLPGGLQQAMAFSGIIVVIMVAIFPGVLKIRMARLAHRASAGDVAIGALLIVFGVTVGAVSLAAEVAKLLGQKGS